MRNVKINGVTYDLDSLDDEVKKHLRYMSFIDSEVERMSMHMNMLRLAREQVGRMLDLAMARHTLKDTAQANPQESPGTTGLAG